MTLELRFCRVGGILVEIPWPIEVLRQYQAYWRRQEIEAMVSMDVFLGRYGSGIRSGPC